MSTKTQPDLKDIPGALVATELVPHIVTLPDGTALEFEIKQLSFMEAMKVFEGHDGKVNADFVKRTIVAAVKYNGAGITYDTVDQLAQTLVLQLFDAANEVNALLASK